MCTSGTIHRSVFSVVLIGLLLITLSAGAGDLKQKKKYVERDVTLDELPEAVKTAILGEAGTHKIRELEEVTGPDGVVYEAEWLVDGEEVEIAVAPDGTILQSGDDQNGDDGEDDDEG
jgi:hypothetical protein